MADAARRTDRHLRAQQAKEFLIAQIIEEAERENVPLSEIERKMLYFTETEETLPDIYEVNEQFESEYDDTEYEEKIAGLLRKARRRIRKESPEDERQWKQAVANLRKEDHYLVVMVEQSLGPSGGSWSEYAWTSAIVACVIAIELLYVFVAERGWIPAQIQKIPFVVWLLGGLLLWAAIKLARMGELGEEAKGIGRMLLGSLPFALRRKRNRRL
jgi:hypothetical protein